MCYEAGRRGRIAWPYPCRSAGFVKPETQWASTEGAKCRLPFLQITGKANVPQVAEGIPTNGAVGVK